MGVLGLKIDYDGEAIPLEECWTVGFKVDLEQRVWPWCDASMRLSSAPLVRLWRFARAWAQVGRLGGAGRQEQDGHAWSMLRKSLELMCKVLMLGCEEMYSGPSQLLQNADDCIYVFRAGDPLSTLPVAGVQRARLLVSR